MVIPLILAALAAPLAALAAPTASRQASITVGSSVVSLATNAASHGSVIQKPTVTPCAVSAERFVHDLVWPFVTGGKFIDWKTYKSNGVNLGAWLEIEKTHNGALFAKYAPDAIDEWTFCESLGSRCGPVMESFYASQITTADIDKLAAVGVNTLRIPTTYAAWVSVPGSKLYHGQQQAWLRLITTYAIARYNMHIIIGLHSLPGGVNMLDIGEASGHDGWFYNTTNLEYSWKAIDAILLFMSTSGHLASFTVAPINEASDNIAGFATPAGLTTNGTNWINTYINGCLARIAKVDSRIPLMLQDSFLGESFWAPFYPASTNMVIDSHVYYFAASGVYSQYVAPAICGQASQLAGDGKFPVFVGEWSLQTLYNNTYVGRKTIFDTERYAWQKYAAGGAFWTVKSDSNATVDGEGTQQDYWSYLDLIKAGVATKATNSSYC